MASEYKHTSTYSYSIANIEQGDMIEILVAGSTDVGLSKAHISATIVECEAFGSGEITIPPADDKGDGDDPFETVFKAEQYVDGTCNLSGVTIDVTGNLQIGDVFQNKGKCFIVTGLSGSNTGINITSTLFPNCEQCRQLVPNP